jgi:hypothetical protein
MAGAFVKRVNNVSNGNTITITPANSGNWLVVHSNTSSGGGNPTATISDNLSSPNWQTAISTVQVAIGFWTTCFYLENCGAGITTITITYSGGTPGTTNSSCAEFSGLATSGSLLAVTAPLNQIAPGGGNDAIFSNNLNFSTVPGLLIGVSYDSTSSNAITAGTGFTPDGTAGSTGALWEHQRLIISNGAIPATFTSATHGTDTFQSYALAVLEPSGNAYTVWGFRA